MKILVTGGCGFIGSHLVEQLVLQGEDVTVIDDLSNGALKNLENVKPFKFIKEDISTYVPEGNFDLIYNLACHPRSMSFENPIRDVEVNVNGMINILECARKCKTLVIFSSNSGIYKTDKIPIDETIEDDPKAPYDLDKLTAEKYCKIYKDLYGVDYILFRFGTVYGPRQQVSPDWHPVAITFLKNATDNKQCEIHGDGKQTRDFIFVSDIVNALLLVRKYADKNLEQYMTDLGYVTKEDTIIGSTMILGTGKETSINELFHLTETIIGHRVNVKYTDPNIGDIRRMCYPSTLARTLLNWSPKVSVEEGLKKIKIWLG